MNSRVESKQIERIPITADDSQLMIGVNALGLYGGARQMLQEAVGRLGKQIDAPENLEALREAQAAIDDAVKAIDRVVKDHGK